MQGYADHRHYQKPIAALWLVMGLLGLCLVAFALGVSDPIESEDWIIGGALFLIFVAAPLVIAWMTLRAKTWLALGWTICGALVWSAALSWVIGNG